MSSALTIVSFCPGDPCDPCQCPWKRYADTVTFKFLTGLSKWDSTVAYAPGDQREYVGQPFQAISPTLGVDPVTAGYTNWTLLDTESLPLDQTQLCAPYWGVGGIAIGSGYAPGDIVSGYFDVTLVGAWANNGSSTLPGGPSSLPPPVHVIYQGVNIFTFNPADGTIVDFVATGDTIDHASGFVAGPFGGGTGIFQGNGPGGVVIYGGGWSALARLTLPGCVFLDSTNSHLIPPYNCVLPYTGPIPDPTTVDQVTPSSDSSDTGPVFFSDLYDETDSGTWVDTGVSFNLAQRASFSSPFYLHAH